MASFNWPPPTPGSGSGITSINGDTTTTQLIVGGSAISAATSSGTTTIGLTGETSDTTTGGGSAVTCNLATTVCHNVTLAGANVTITLTNPVAAGYTYVIRLIQDSTGGWTYTWSISGRTIKWPSGVAPLPSGASHIDIVQFYDDGTNLYGSFSGNY